MTDFDMDALERALTKREKSEKRTSKTSDKPIFTTVDKEGKEVNPEDIEEGKVYRLKQSS